MMMMPAGWIHGAEGRPAVMSLNRNSTIANSFQPEKQLTRGRYGHILTNIGVWSPDGAWIVYDARSDPAGELFDGSRIEMVNVQTGEVKVLYQARNGAHCGVATFSPVAPRVVFILGPENPSAGWEYSPSHRQGVLVDLSKPGAALNLDARDLLPPFTSGALRGGSHVHVFSGDGQWVSFTYEDHFLNAFQVETDDQDINLRGIGVSVPLGPVRVRQGHPRNHDGQYFSVLATRLRAKPQPGSDQIKRAAEEAWVGTNGYARTDGTWQKRALAFQGHVVTNQGESIAEVFIVDLPENVTIPGDGPLAGTEQRRPFPPKGVVQRRLTFTSGRKYPGLQGPRHWLRSSPDGSRIAFLMRDDEGVVQLWTVSPNGGLTEQLTRNHSGIASAFTWSPNGRAIAHVLDNSVAITDADTGVTKLLTPAREGIGAPRPEACVFSPDGTRIAFVRRVGTGRSAFNQVCGLFLESHP